MGARRNHLTTWRVTALCEDCDWGMYARDYRNIANRILKHANAAGHAVAVEQVKRGVVDRRPTTQ